MVDQQTKIFYSNKNSIDWKEFPVELLEFSVEPKGEYLFALTKDGNVLRFSSPDTYQKISTETMKHASITVRNKNLYYFNYENERVGKIGSAGHEEYFLYTNDRPIPAPIDNKKATYLTWGWHDKNLYLSDDYGKTWYREDVLGFPVKDFTLLNDSNARIWNGEATYAYSLKDHTPKAYSNDNPFSDFLKDHVQRIEVESGTQGCFHYLRTVAEYRINGSLLVCDSIKNFGGRGTKLEKFKRSPLILCEIRDMLDDKALIRLQCAPWRQSAWCECFSFFVLSHFRRHFDVNFAFCV